MPPYTQVILIVCVCVYKCTSRFIKINLRIQSAFSVHTCMGHNYFWYWCKYIIILCLNMHASHLLKLHLNQVTAWFCISCMSFLGLQFEKLLPDTAIATPADNCAKVFDHSMSFTNNCTNSLSLSLLNWQSSSCIPLPSCYVPHSLVWLARLSPSKGCGLHNTLLTKQM